MREVAAVAGVSLSTVSRVVNGGAGVRPDRVERVRDAVRGAIRIALDLPRQRRPIVEVQITRLGADTLATFEPMEEALP